ncbi:uncharacterized protein EV420DRAFT_1655982 [Desarmillaria tabescens]|uniref:Uncharacterized protein n=1 Tax=Armillaria tabescens TaxID=1929756 RepID=A0AA39IYV4_ARMTA|nr:uncharacterized protein EV420DRAFT_1655982 [Desarmillaria tabescens]KAK0432102.1 hypothetical protein EV420DRAFT_1655982 [Desarmillaria tabescens]
MYLARVYSESSDSELRPISPTISPIINIDEGLDIDGTTFVSPLPTSPTLPGQPPESQEKKLYHPYLSGEKCDKDGEPLPPDSPPPPLAAIPNVWAPFDGEVQFRLADFLFHKVEMSQRDIDELMDLWALDLHKHEDDAPFDNHQALYKAIDEIHVGSAPWKCFQTVVPPNLGADAPDWQKQPYQVWFHDPDLVIANILVNRDFEKEFDTAPYVHLDAHNQRRWSDFMSGNYSWRHATQIYEANNDTEGAMYIGVILGSDKTTVSVATGNVEYYPVYLSIGNLHNSARQGHRNGVVPIAFLAIPKSDRKYDCDLAFWLFKKKLYHQSLTAILHSLQPAMTVPVVRQCPDGFYRRVIYDLGPYIADYPEQVLLAGIVQGWCTKCTAPATNLDGSGDRCSCTHTEALLESLAGQGDVLWDNYGIDEDILPFTFNFPHADIHEMMSSDLLHQIIKGSFKDHLVEWVFESPNCCNASLPWATIISAGSKIQAMDWGRFKSPNEAVVSDYLPESIMRCLSAFMDFCYLIRHSDFDETTLKQVQDTIQRFHHYHEAFRVAGVHEDFSLPRQHAIVHYPSHIMEFGAPNGLCSSITESWHITAVKKPWRRSNRYNALSQMLLTNQWLDKLAALRADLVQQGLLEPLHAPLPDPFDTGLEDEGTVDGDHIMAEVSLARTAERLYPRNIVQLGHYVGQANLHELTQRFLYEQLTGESSDHVSLDECPKITMPISVFHSATATFYSPSDISGIRGMHHEHIRATPSWHGYPRYDCALTVTNERESGFRGMSAVRILLLFSSRHEGTEFPCTLVHWFKRHGHSPDPKMGMWIVQPEYQGVRHNAVITVVHLDALLRGAHLMPVFGAKTLPHKFHYSRSLDCFSAFYISKYADHHMHEIV